ncbi:MAG: ACP S-malonyltransferase [Deltaproteobacteria bacterium]|nr:ACP S-malonyltransferase [Deltaproteobacteria bacterium]
MSSRGLVFLFPGQGSQYVGMGKVFYDEYQEVRDLFSRANKILEMDMEQLCFEGPEDELVLTHNVQPAITLINIACSMVLRLRGVEAAAAAGHSLGEYSALHLAGVIDERAVLELVRLRGQLMQGAADEQPGAMAAILNLPADKIDEVCDTCEIEMANYNSPGQIIVSGFEEGVLRAMEICSDAGAKRCVRLNVSGPWHSRCMVAAKEKFEPELAQYAFQDPKIPVVANVNADYVRDGSGARENLVRQLCAPVRWQQSMERLINDGHQRFVEVGPKKVLKGLMRQIDRNAEVYNVDDLESLEAFLKSVREEE